MTRLAACLALLAVGCSVPAVSFYPDDATSNPDTSGADGDDAADASIDSDASTAADADTGAVSDAPYDGPAYCTPDGAPAPAGTKCCDVDAEPGVVCSGTCNAPSCAACAGCALPNICCSKGAHGTCELQCQ